MGKTQLWSITKLMSRANSLITAGTLIARYPKVPALKSEQLVRRGIDWITAGQMAVTLLSEYIRYRASVERLNQTASSGRSYFALPIRSLMVGYATVNTVKAMSPITVGKSSHFAPYAAVEIHK